jgi:hypothetical protein
VSCSSPQSKMTADSNDKAGSSRMPEVEVQTLACPQTAARVDSHHNTSDDKELVLLPDVDDHAGDIVS